jgi:hypothetical protein
LYVVEVPREAIQAALPDLSIPLQPVGHVATIKLNSRVRARITALAVSGVSTGWAAGLCATVATSVRLSIDTNGPPTQCFARAAPDTAVLTGAQPACE